MEYKSLETLYDTISTLNFAQRAMGSHTGFGPALANASNVPKGLTLLAASFKTVQGQPHGEYITVNCCKFLKNALYICF